MCVCASSQLDVKLDGKIQSRIRKITSKTLHYELSFCFHTTYTHMLFTLNAMVNCTITNHLDVLIKLILGVLLDDWRPHTHTHTRTYRWDDGLNHITYDSLISTPTPLKPFSLFFLFFAFNLQRYDPRVSFPYGLLFVYKFTHANNNSDDCIRFYELFLCC